MLSEIRAYMETDLFHPEKLLGAGPAAKVYRGVETMTGRKVLIKSLLRDHETPHALDRERLQLFAPSLMQLRHPQIAGLITLIPTEEEFGIVSEFMPGMNIRTLAAARQVPPADLRALAVQFMHALLVGEHLRQPHGDPKPSNVIIADHPGGGLFLQVQDWGLSLTRQFHPAETLWFRAPELHYGGMPTSQSDLFTAAASLFCLATNSAPAQSELAAELVQQWHAFNAPYALQHLRPDLDPPLRDWLAWLMQPDPRLRPQCVAQALDALMVTMHTGFIYMPQQAPQMMPGTQTTPLIPAAAPAPPPASAPASSSVPTAHPNAPKPKPVPRPRPATPTPAAPAVAKEKEPPAVQEDHEVAEAVPVAAAVTDDKPPAATARKRPSTRVLVGVALNLAALVLLGFFLWPAVSGAQKPARWEQDAQAATPATPLPTAAAVPPAPAKAKSDTPAPAVAAKSDGAKKESSAKTAQTGVSATASK